MGSVQRQREQSPAFLPQWFIGHGAFEFGDHEPRLTQRQPRAPQLLASHPVQLPETHALGVGPGLTGVFGEGRSPPELERRPQLRDDRGAGTVACRRRDGSLESPGIHRVVVQPDRVSRTFADQNGPRGMCHSLGLECAAQV